MSSTANDAGCVGWFQCSSASRKFLNFPNTSPRFPSDYGFSALQRAENSSIQRVYARIHTPRRFQCSSASRKFLNPVIFRCGCTRPVSVSVLFSEPKIPQFGVARMFQTYTPCFSALQRAENSSIWSGRTFPTSTSTFQCSSASRKFLKFASSSPRMITPSCFSALQRAENSSNDFEVRVHPPGQRFSALQRAENSSN